MVNGETNGEFRAPARLKLTLDEERAAFLLIMTALREQDPKPAKFLQETHQQQYATFHNKREAVGRLVAIDELFVRVSKNWLNPPSADGGPVTLQALPALLVPAQVAQAVRDLIGKAEADMGLPAGTGSDQQRLQRLLTSGEPLPPDIYEIVHAGKEIKTAGMDCGRRPRTQTAC